MFSKELEEAIISLTKSGNILQRHVTILLHGNPRNRAKMLETLHELYGEYKKQYENVERLMEVHNVQKDGMDNIDFNYSNDHSDACSCGDLCERTDRTCDCTKKKSGV